MRSFLRVRAVLSAATLLATLAVTGGTTAAPMSLAATHAFAVALAASPVGPQAGESTTAGDDEKLDAKATAVKQFLHYINIAKPEAAVSEAQALLDGGLTAADLARIVDGRNLGERFDAVMIRGRGMEGVADLAIRFEQMLRDGRLELAREPGRIADAVSLLTGTLRQQMFAKERLAAAGEYAMPQLLKVVTTGKDAGLEVAATRVIEEMRRYAVHPLCAALPKLDPTNQRKVCDMLGEIGYPAALPYLLEVARASGTPTDVKLAAERAVSRIGGGSNDVSNQFAELARRFFDGDESLVSYPSEPTNNVWSYDPFGGLAPTPVPTAIFAEVMSMLAAKQSLTHNAANAPALAVYVAADLRRENRLPDGLTDPIFGQSPHSPAFFAMAAGPATDSAVLGIAIDRRDTALVRDAIAAIAQTAGAATLIGAGTGSGGRQPLIESLRYPEKRVQYDAALAIGNALPERTFSGDFAIVPILASAVRDAGTVVGGVVSATEEDRRQIASKLAGIGFTTLAGGATFGEFEPEINASIGLDVLIVAGDLASVKAGVASARLANSTAAAPIVVIVQEADIVAAAASFERDQGVVVWPNNGSDEGFKQAVEAAFTHQSGGRIVEDEALDYTVRSLETLKKIAISRSGVFSIQDAERPLLDALASRSGGVRLLVADVLALLPSAEAQRKLIDAALTSTDESEKIELLGRAATSARTFGNQSEARQVETLRGLVAGSSGTLAEAAGRLYGALNLSSAETVKLITQPAAPAGEGR